MWLAGSVSPTPREIRSPFSKHSVTSPSQEGQILFKSGKWVPSPWSSHYRSFLFQSLLEGDVVQPPVHSFFIQSSFTHPSTHSFIRKRLTNISWAPAVGEADHDEHRDPDGRGSVPHGGGARLQPQGGAGPVADSTGLCPHPLGLLHHTPPCTQRLTPTGTTCVPLSVGCPQEAGA